MKYIKWYSWSKFSIMITIFFLYREGVTNPKAWQTRNNLKHDANVYYVYLPSLFIHGDMSLSWTTTKDSEDLRRKGFLNSYSPNRELKVPRMTMGVAITNIPFFLGAHLFSKITGLPLNGYSNIYSCAIWLGTIVFACIGFIFLRKILLRDFSEIATALTIVSIGLCTNFFYYTVFQSGMSHTRSFTLITVFIFCCIKYYDSKTTKLAICIGLLLGLIVLIRPVNGIVILFPLFYDGFSFSKLKVNLSYWLSEPRHVFLILCMSLLIIIPQFIFWKYNTGFWFFNSYGHLGAFYWTNPHVYEGLIGYNKGWLIYTPIMFFAVIGIVLLWFKNRKYFFSISIIFCLAVYIMFSFWCWWYGGAFGCRPMIDYYGLLAIPLCLFYSLFTRWLITGPVVLMLFFGFLNQFQTNQYTMTLLHWDGMSKELYWEIFLSTKWPKNYRKLLVRPHNISGLKGITKWVRYDD